MEPAASFEAFVAEHREPLLRFAMTLTSDHRRSEDLVADVLGTIFEKWSRVSAVDNPAAYVRRSIVNCFISQGRHAAQWHRLAPRLFSGQRDIPDTADEFDERAAMRRRLDRLPPRQRAVLAMRYYLDMPDEQIADILGCRQATVRSHAAQGLAALRIDLAVDATSTYRPPTSSESRPS